ncbi:Maf family protein [Floccifex sp.]|uniref:Maf family protein n=1 Tax=Floccifex sp. TaxID=2815810 RepID=UPI003EFBC1B7
MIILASQSPRRKEILSSLGYDFVVCPSKQEETFDVSISIDEALKKVTIQKAKDIQQKYNNDCIVSADTIVVFQGHILGKPSSHQEAYETLKQLSNSIHEVKTGMCVLFKDQIHFEISTTKVKFKELSDTQILEYIQSNRCMDKAGSYGIQEVDFVQWIEGSYSNVVGLDQDIIQKLLSKVASSFL